MKLRILYFILGAVFIFTVGVLGFLWKSYHQYEVDRMEENLAGMNPVVTSRFTADDLVGTWHGKEGWGIKYVITRRKDGTFTEIRDMRGGDAYMSKNPAFIKSEGRWTLSDMINSPPGEDGKLYSLYYIKSSDPSWANMGPLNTVLHPYSPREFYYFFDEGDGVNEKKE